MTLTLTRVQHRYLIDVTPASSLQDRDSVVKSYKVKIGYEFDDHTIQEVIDLMLTTNANDVGPQLGEMVLVTGLRSYIPCQLDDLGFFGIMLGIVNDVVYNVLPLPHVALLRNVIYDKEECEEVFAFIIGQTDLTSTELDNKLLERFSCSTFPTQVSTSPLVRLTDHKLMAGKGNISFLTEVIRASNEFVIQYKTV